MTDFKAFTPSF